MIGYVRVIWAATLRLLSAGGLFAVELQLCALLAVFLLWGAYRYLGNHTDDLPRAIDHGVSIALLPVPELRP